MELNVNDDQARGIVDAIRAGDLESLSAQLRETPELAKARIVDERGVSRSLLHIVTDWPGHAPHSARVIAQIVAAGADVNARVTSRGAPVSSETPLHWAASCNDLVAIDALLDHGADLEATGAVHTGGTPLSDAVVFAQWDAARKLVERGAQSTLWQAAALGLVDQLDNLLFRDPSPPPAELTNAFWHACRGGQLTAAQRLHERGADLNWIGHDHKTPYDVAREAGESRLIAWLESLGGRSARSL